MPAQIQKTRRLCICRLYSREAVFEIGDDVVDVLRADRKADGVLGDACRLQLLVGELMCVRYAGSSLIGRMDHEGFYVRNVGEQ